MASSGISRAEVEKAPGLLRGGEHRDRPGPVELLVAHDGREALFVAAEDPEKEHRAIGDRVVSGAAVSRKSLWERHVDRPRALYSALGGAP